MWYHVISYHQYINIYVLICVNKHSLYYNIFKKKHIIYIYVCIYNVYYCITFPCGSPNGSRFSLRRLQSPGCSEGNEARGQALSCCCPASWRRCHKPWLPWQPWQPWPDDLFQSIQSDVWLQSILMIKIRMFCSLHSSHNCYLYWN